MKAMNEFNLLYPEGFEPAFQRLNETTCNDLSLDYILSHVAKSDCERNIMKGIMTTLESRPEVIRYRRDIFEDFMRFPSFKEGIRYSLDQLDYRTSPDIIESLTDPSSPYFREYQRLSAYYVKLKQQKTENEGNIFRRPSASRPA